MAGDQPSTSNDERDQLVYAFEEGSRDQKYLLGGKGANLAEMTNLGLPVPPGFIITTDACRAYLEDEQVPDGLVDEVAQAMEALQEKAGKRFGDASNPLLLSVRSGAPFSMPGMMDTVLNLGLNDETAAGLAKATDDERFAWDAYRRFLQLFGKVVLGVPGTAFEERLEAVVEQRGVHDESGLDAEDLRGLVDDFKQVIDKQSDAGFPQDPTEQLHASIEAVFRSWNGRRARDYRRHEGIADDLGTAVNVQTMVFGNLGTEEDSGTGVAFTRDPATGESKPYGDWLPGAQGEDVVAGIRNTRSLEELADAFPECHGELTEVFSTLEHHYQDMCDIEFTIESSKLYILQTRVGKRTAVAALRMAVDMVSEGLIDERTAVTRVTPTQLDQLLHPQFKPGAEYDVLVKGLNASPGAAVGHVRFTADEAEAHAADEPVILVRPETSPDDLHGLIAAQGVLTSRGGLVSHAAVVARGMGKPAICGASEVAISLEKKEFRVGDTVVRDGDVISLNGTTGEVVVGEVEVETPEPTGPFAIVLGWADDYRRLGVRANADTGEDAARAREYGAEGIGLCRTEHMFLGERLPVVQRMILADTEQEEAEALDELQRVQRTDFLDLLREMDGLPVTVRLLDPPLHEFLPDYVELVVAQAKGELDERGEQLLRAARHWQEVNPMLGTRGCRLGILKPGLYRMQTKALIAAAAELKKEGGDPRVEIMIPLVVTVRENRLIDGWIREAADEALQDAGVELDYEVGTMIETPRAALTADRIAQVAQFFSFGTNDLTQMTFGFSRDDVESMIMPTYLELNLVEVDPFAQLDWLGVGRLIKMAVEEGRSTRPDLHLGVCGEHGGDPASVKLCHEYGLDYVSCSPFRVPVARLAAAHAAIGAGEHAAST